MLSWKNSLIRYFELSIGQLGTIRITNRNKIILDQLMTDHWYKENVESTFSLILFVRKKNIRNDFNNRDKNINYE